MKYEGDSEVSTLIQKAGKRWRTTENACLQCSIISALPKLRNRPKMMSLFKQDMTVVQDFELVDAVVFAIVARN